jgi:hypothetical protein
MDAIEHLETTAWKHPRDYGGFSPDGDYCILSKHRESDALTRSNWDCISAELNAEPYDGGADDFSNRPITYHWRAGHWAVGWVEYLMLRADAPDAIKQTAGEIICALSDYPVYDEDHYSELEYTETAEYWEHMRVRDRFDAIKQSASTVSIFAARHATLPADDSGALFEYLRQP